MFHKNILLLLLLLFQFDVVIDLISRGSLWCFISRVSCLSNLFLLTKNDIMHFNKFSNLGVCL